MQRGETVIGKVRLIIKGDKMIQPSRLRIDWGPKRILHRESEEKSEVHRDTNEIGKDDLFKEGEIINAQIGKKGKEIDQEVRKDHLRDEGNPILEGEGNLVTGLTEAGQPINNEVTPKIVDDNSKEIEVLDPLIAKRHSCHLNSS
jgi:hypothetical protein